MNAYTYSGPSSAVASISDLDGYTLREYNSYIPADQDEFGFDPPEQKPFFSKPSQMYSPPQDITDSPMGDWPSFGGEEDNKQKSEPEHLYQHQLDKLITSNLPNNANAISRFGQVTPPRTNSAGAESVEVINIPKIASRRKSKDTKSSEQPKPATSGRKRKNTRKAPVNVGSSEEPEDNKRKASLEKNRLAAAKCRVNKKEKTEILQRDSHDKAVHNVYLKDQVMRMKEEVQQLNVLLLAHASCEGCKSPGEIQKHLQELSADYLPQQVNISGYPDHAEMPLDGLPPHNHDGNDYFSLSTHGQGMLNPPLPDFNRSANFEVHTPMQTD